MKNYMICFTVFISFASSAIATISPWYWKLGAGYAWSNNTVFTDKSCSSTSPAALFGCGYSAGGSFGNSESFDIAIGYRFNPIFHGEALLNYQPNYRFSGNANFLNAGSNQPVSSDVSSLGLMATGYIDLASVFGYKESKWQPFVGLGLGLSRNHTGSMTYEFPTLSQPNDSATTKTSSGSSISFAYMLAAGVNWKLNSNTGLEFSYRWYDLGNVETDDGSAYIHGHGCGGASDCTINIAGTKASLKTQSLMLSLWHTF
ncbi:outer membrane protein [Piscirickettsia litoralis]|uniref:Outer membrane protein beta-barrel domain-containing protein n=1 Tax=Piscirickettsia litoralis TaxID=1891921 RepID=A0ABX2ZYD7_9GAMM|nr:outer membrane beta-barrel protein [Piscirickettsia litoralis]ODN41629.1 hypothetical protein BGC07_16175 [Piscirickettsia litoralis]